MVMLIAILLLLASGVGPQDHSHGCTTNGSANFLRALEGRDVIFALSYMKRHKVKYLMFDRSLPDNTDQEVSGELPSKHGPLDIAIGAGEKEAALFIKKGEYLLFRYDGSGKFIECTCKKYYQGP